MTDDPDTPDAIHQSALILDAHADSPQRLLDLPGSSLTSPLGPAHFNLASARAGNLAAQFLALWVDPAEFPAPLQTARALTLADAVLEDIRRHPESLRLCLTPADILAARAPSPAPAHLALLLGLEGGHAIANSLALLRTFHRLGVRYLTLTWSNSNDWATSSGDPRYQLNPAADPGLSPFGHQVIAEMNRLGMMIDLSHASDRTFADVLAASAAPVIASHSSARALTPAPRNLTDDQLRLLASRDGLALANFFPAFISDTWRLAWNALAPERRAAQLLAAAPFRATGTPVPFTTSNDVDRLFAARIPRPPLSALIDHLDHMIRIAGPRHVGLGSDFDGIPALPQGIDSAADLPRITAALHARGHSAQTLHLVLGQNFLRTFTAIQSQAG